MNKLLVICGPTATGKTQLALKLAGKFNGVVVSADSRQVYKYMDIGTGKEGNVFGYDLVLPNEDFSVSQYMKYVHQKIEEILSNKKLPILVGGSGLYIKAVVDGIETAQVVPDKVLRDNLKNKTLQELLEILRNSDPQKASVMNQSDRQNPRRLIRAIEVASQKNQYHNNLASKVVFNSLFIGLTGSQEELKRRINTRVDDRIKMGFQKEIDFLKDHGYWDGVRCSTLGYREWPDVDQWKVQELKYAKRQLTWFKKDTRINWLDISSPNFQEKAEILVENWLK